MLTIDYANCLADRVGEHGIAACSLAPGSASADACRSMTASLESSRGTGWERWRTLPHAPMRGEHLDSIAKAVDASGVREPGRFENILVLGIGGSALGSAALHAALRPPTHNVLPSWGSRNGPRLFVLDNVDPALVRPTLEYITEHAGGFEKTLVNVISKSGETAETAAQFMALRGMLIGALGKAKHAEHVVAVTDPAKGTMRSICDANGYTTLPVPDGVGGRFSVLSPVGLFSAAACGLDAGALLDGAAEMDARCREPELLSNPAALLATLLVRLGTEKAKPIHTLMPYTNSLYTFADWFRQLWAESLGKSESLNGAPTTSGFTPAKALGATDQHSQIQLYREGPNDKVIGFLEVADHGADITIPAQAKGDRVEALSYLEGASLGALLDAEKRATEYALVQSKRPNFTIGFPTLDERHLGQAIWLWQMATAYAGRMLGVDAYNQPAVELGKQATFGLLGRTGYGAFREQVDAGLAPTAHTL